MSPHAAHQAHLRGHDQPLCGVSHDVVLLLHVLELLEGVVQEEDGVTDDKRKRGVILSSILSVSEDRMQLKFHTSHT